ncbi:unnamed protein product [Caenorhabditis nigoni]
MSGSSLIFWSRTCVNREYPPYWLPNTFASFGNPGVLVLLTKVKGKFDQIQIIILHLKSILIDFLHGNQCHRQSSNGGDLAAGDSFLENPHPWSSSIGGPIAEDDIDIVS